mgnify:CR=1 FL=1
MPYREVYGESITNVTFLRMTEVAMREKEIEGRLVSETKRRGGLCLKWVCPGFDGGPDRIILMPYGKVGFAELKAPGRKPRLLQASRHRLFRKLGFAVYIIDDPEQVTPVLDEIGGTGSGEV